MYYANHTIQLLAVVLQRDTTYSILKKLQKIQLRTALWITDAFCTSSTWRVEAIAGFIPIYLYLNKISRRYHLKVVSLPLQDTINSLHYSKKAKSYYQFILLKNNAKKSRAQFFCLIDCIKSYSQVFVQLICSLIIFTFIQQTTKI